MRAFFKIILFLSFVFILLIPPLLVWKAADPYPYIKAAGPISQQDILRAREIIRDNRPDRTGPRQNHTLELTAHDLNLLVRYALGQGLGIDGIGSRVDLKNNQVICHLSVPLPDTPLGKYLNISVGIALNKGVPRIYWIQAGALTIPGSVAQSAAELAHTYLLKLDAYGAAYGMMDGVRQIRIQPDLIQLSYSLNPGDVEGLKSKVKQQLFSQIQQERIKRYHNLLADSAVCYGGRQIPLVNILPPLFAAAAENTRSSGDPAGENKALLQVLAAFVSQRSMSDFMSAQIRRDLNPLPNCTPMLFGREDLAQHLLVSAGLTVSASGNLANVIGLAKEIEDAEAGGSGFSFADLAADKAGVRLGELAAGSPDQAGRLQQRIMRLQRDGELMPDISDLPAPMSASAFRQRYQNINSPAYKTVENYIEAKLAGCSVLQD
ncbi:MAG: hypothetical protein MI802_15875 [Desulfobacterales bacterium]|nr:hypothetical protein [Desulfobacterales bacterium]